MSSRKFIKRFLQEKYGEKFYNQQWELSNPETETIFLNDVLEFGDIKINEEEAFSLVESLKLLTLGFETYKEEEDEEKEFQAIS